MSICSGIASTEHGTFILATVAVQSRKYKVRHYREWSALSFVRNFLLLHKRANVAIASHWVRTPPSGNEELLIKPLPDGFHVCLHQSELQHCTDTLTDNIQGIVPDMVLLLTLPRTFMENIPHSFCSVLNDNGVIRIGVISDMKLTAVFSAAGIATTDEFYGFLGRIERYWKNSVQENRTPFPTGVVYSVNALPFESDDENRYVPIDCGTDSSDELKALGAALCDVRESYLLQTSDETNPGNGIIKSVIFYVSLLLIMLPLVTAGIMHLYNAHLERNITAITAKYNNLLNNNSDIRSLIGQGDHRARQVLQRNTVMNHTTTWSEFLQILGASRKESLFFERLGTEPIDKSPDMMRVAISGWCKNETVVTDFIKELSNNSLLDNVSLASIERIPKQETACTFKVLCRLSLSKK